MAVAVTVARPVASVTAGDVVIAADAPPSGEVNVTDTPDTGLPPESFTMATSGFVKAVLTAALWPLPLLTAIVAAAPAVLVSVNVADVAPGTEAVTL